MFRKLFGRKINGMQALFKDHFVEVKALYANQFDKIPCVSFIGELDATKALAFVKEKCQHEIVSFLQHAYFDHEAQKMLFNNTILILSDERIVEVACNYAQVLHKDDQYAWAIKLIKELAAFKATTASPGTPATIVGFARQSTLN